MIGSITQRTCEALDITKMGGLKRLGHALILTKFIMPKVYASFDI